MSDAEAKLGHPGGSIHRLAADELFQRLPYFALDPERILDLGAGDCDSSAGLQQRFASAQVLALDPSWNALKHAPAAGWFRRARYQRVCGAIGSLPLRAHSIDLVLGHLLLPHRLRPEEFLPEISRVLRPGGVLLFSSLWADLQRTSSERPEPPPDLADWGQWLMRSGFCEPVIDVERYRVAYGSVEALQQDRAAFCHEGANRDEGNGGIAVTYELIIGAAFASPSPPVDPDQDVRGEVTIMPASIRLKRP